MYDYDLEALVFFDQQKHQQARYELTYLQANAGRNIVPSATVKLRIGEDQEVTATAVGNGPVDAAFNAIIQATGVSDIDIVDFKLDSKGEGADALAQVSVVAEYHGRRFHGIGLATDIVESGVKALIFVLNNTHMADQIDIQRQQSGLKISGV